MKNVNALKTVEIYNEAGTKKIATGKTSDDINTATSISVTDIIYVDGYQGTIVQRNEYILKVGGVRRGLMCTAINGNSANFE